MSIYDRSYGVEIECKGHAGATRERVAADITAAGILCRAEPYNHRVTGNWKIVTDGSLSDYANGMEIVSPPLKAEQGFREIDTVCSVLAQRGIKIDKSCGLHVHADSRRPAPLELGDLKKLTMLYVECETIIDSMLPPSRRGSANPFCSPLASLDPRLIEQASDANALATVIKFNRLPRPREQFPSGHQDRRRYSKLNILPSWSQGTVEFRQHSGTIDAQKIQNWVNLSLRMIDTAVKDPSISAAQVAHVQRLARSVRQGTKRAIVYDMLLREQGCTLAEVLAATGWAEASVAGIGRQYGMEIRKVREFGSYRYFGKLQLSPAIEPPQVLGSVERPAKPSNIAEFAARIGMPDTELQFWSERGNMFAQPTLNLQRTEYQEG